MKNLYFALEAKVFAKFEGRQIDEGVMDDLRAVRREFELVCTSNPHPPTSLAEITPNGKTLHPIIELCYHEIETGEQ